MITEHKISAELTTQLLGSIQADVHSLKEELSQHILVDTEAMEAHKDHHNYIEILIKKEEQRIAFRQAIIEKTVSSLLWSASVGTLALLWQFIKDHWR